MIRDHFAALYSLLEDFPSDASRTEDDIWDNLIKTGAAAVGSEAATYFEAEEKQRMLTFS